ncbi:MAG: PQQ-dependent sugar dehydrogenase [Bacteroidetes bacterium]|nr:PQQ-dependent sugar dehydrogenase [Bacteroidota bacterium]
MKKFRYLYLLLILFLTVSDSFSQYKLRPAFPNLPVFSYPIEMIPANDGSNRLFVLQQRGLVYVFNNSSTVSTRKTFLNLSGKVSPSGSELGLLGIALHPNYASNRYLYVNYTFDSAGSGSGSWSRVSRFTASSVNPDTVLLNTELILMTLSQPFSNHNGGKVAFGPDGYLYLSFGDGGSGGDPNGNGQNRSVLLGKILRINVDSAASGKNYSIPVTNPFYGNLSGYKEEIYSYGMRNTWKFSFDDLNGKLWAGDVGQNLYEEIDIIESGKNYGWNKMEGYHCYGTCDTTGKGFTRPVWEYSHSLGSSITGGYVYRGSLLPGLYGKYIYGDYGAGTVWALTYDFINPATNIQLQDTNFLISSFGLDNNKEVYALSYSSTNGQIYKIVNTSVITLNLKAAIQGFYDNTTNRMSIKDTSRIYLRSNVSPYQLIDSSVTLMDSVSLSGLCFFNNAPTGTYYIVVKHRNGILTWSKNNGENLVKGSLINYDFTNDSSKAYGNNQIRKGNIYCIYNGDADQDGTIDATDVSLIDNGATNGLSGYVSTDLTGDNFVDAEDQSIADNNSLNSISVINP